MYFKRLEMQGFKSFAEPVVIEFHQGITCIVGPNGSGKSNISDAIRWVLGEQSPRALRGGKMEEVIFNGTENRRPRGMAEVTLVIDNSDGSLNIEYKEVAITRRMFRSGESEYRINDNPCRLKDIRELIMDTGIGVDGYSIIGQGRIQDIVSNKPESRREIFEEAAGVVAYKTRRAEAEKKLGGTRNNLERIDDIVGEIEGRIDGLKKDSQKARRYLELREQYKMLEINIILRNIDTCGRHSDEYRGDIADLDAKIKFMEGNRKTSETEVLELNKRTEVLDRIAESTHAKLVSNVERINVLRGQSRLNEEKLANIEKEEERLEKEIASLNQKISDGQGELENLKDQRDEIQNSEREAQRDLQEKLYKLRQIQGSSDRYGDTIEDSNEQIIRLNSESASKKSEARSIENYKSTLEKRRKEIEEESDAVRRAQHRDTEELRRAEGKYKQAKEQKDRLDSENAEREYHYRERIAQRDSLRKEIEKLRIDISRHESRRRTFEEMEQNFDGYNYAVKYIMRCGISGIEGVVGESMGVPQGYETAVETALGAQMQNIICADEQSARRAITALKINKSGRLTFLPVSSVRGNKADPPSAILEDPGYLGVLCDIIDYDHRYRRIFEYLLGRVLCVDELNTAIRLSKAGGRGLRFVTLDGEIINAGGAITGGRYRNQSANLLERKNEIAKLKHETEQLQNQLSSLEKEQGVCEASIRQLDQALQATADDGSENALSMAALKEKISALNHSLEESDRKLNKNQLENETIERELDEADGMIERMLDESKSAEAEIERISREVEEITADYEERRSNIEQAQAEVTEARLAAGQWSGRVSAAETLITRVEEELKDQRKQNREHEDHLREIRREKSHMENGGSSSLYEIQELEQDRKSLDEQAEETSREKTDIAARLKALSEEQEKNEREIRQSRDQKYQLEIKSAKNETQMDNLKDKLWDEFEVSYAQAMDYKEDHFAMSSGVSESRRIRKELRELGDVNVGAIEEYEQVNKRYQFLTEQRQDVVKAVDELVTIIDQLDGTITRTFKESFNQVEYNFEKVFSELFGGGHAELRLEDETDPLESGIEIVAQPPGKRLQNINLMSGGEKTMTAIALMFAVLKTRPTPFCILDEVEAALDDDNIDRFSDYLRNFGETQFALITHQKATMEHADVLYGITMPEHGVSKVLSLRIGDYDPDDYTD